MSWGEYEKLVLDKLDTLEEGQKALVDEVTKVRVELARLQVKSGLWGAAASILVVMAALLLKLL